jgi:hypothetical protein
MLDWGIRAFTQKNAFPLAYQAASTGCPKRLYEGAAGYPYDSSRGKAAPPETSQEVEQLLP